MIPDGSDKDGHSLRMLLQVGIRQFPAEVAYDFLLDKDRLVATRTPGFVNSLPLSLGSFARQIIHIKMVQCQFWKRSRETPSPQFEEPLPSPSGI
jgi:hypothetical protein